MPNHNDLTWLPAHQLRDLIRDKQVSPVELAELSLSRIEKLNPKLNAFLTVTPELALESARQAEQDVQNGDDLGPLHGIPIPIKDIEELAGVRFTSGSLVYKDRIGEVDSIPAGRIRASGAIIVGKTNTSEFGQIGTNENRLGDACRNPWNPELTSGASSGGSAVSVATGITPIAQGGDGGGSIRIPASFCGIYGIKPAQQRVPRWDVGLDSHHPIKFAQVGPLTRNVRDAAILLQVIAGPHEGAEPDTIATPPPDFEAALDRDITDLRIGWSSNLGGLAVDPEVASIAENAAKVFNDLGAHVEDADFRLGSPEEVFETFEVLYDSRVYATNGHLLRDNSELLTDYLTEGLEKGRNFTAEQLFDAMSRLEQYRTYVRDYFTRYDLLLTPTLATPPFPIGEFPTEINGQTVPHEYWGFTPFTYPFNMCRNPAASIPAGFTRSGLSVGLHVVGRHEDEETVLTASARFEEARPWADQKPPIATE